MSGCYCGSGVAYEKCCGPIHEGSVKAATAEVLMRARYSAFAAKKAEFLHQSLHPDYRHDHDVEATRRWAEGAEWLGLEVVAMEDGGESDNEGIVEFIATYKEQGVVRPHHERGRFRKQDGDWYFVDGELVAPKTEKRSQPKIGRNDPCPCGSGKKYKKCCGA